MNKKEFMVFKGSVAEGITAGWRFYIKNDSNENLSDFLVWNEQEQCVFQVGFDKNIDKVTQVYKVKQVRSFA